MNNFSKVRELIKRETLEGALIISVLCTLFTLPSLWYLCFVGMKKALKGLEIHVFLVHLWGIFLISFLCGAFGLGWAKALGLEGIVNKEKLKKYLPIIFAFGFVVGIGSFFLIDIHLLDSVPYLYPQDLLFALATPLKGAFLNEVIRFGGMAFVMCFLKNLHLSNTIISTFFLYLGLRGLRLCGLEIGFEDWIVGATVWGFFVNLVMGYLYAKIGIVATMLVQFVAGLRLLLFSL